MGHANLAAESLVGDLPPPPLRPGRTVAMAGFGAAAGVSLAMAAGGYRLWRAPDGLNRDRALALWAMRFAVAALRPGSASGAALVCLDGALVLAARKVDGGAAAFFAAELLLRSLALTSRIAAR